MPICGDYCDDWYEACKDDETCVKDWQVGSDYSNLSFTYTCPKDVACSTFKQVRSQVNWKANSGGGGIEASAFQFF